MKPQLLRLIQMKGILPKIGCGWIRVHDLEWAELRTIITRWEGIWMVWLKIILKNLDALVISHITGHVQVLVLLFPPVSAFRSSHEHVRFFSRHPPFNGHGFRRFPNCTSSCKKLPRMRKKTGDSMEVLTGKTINLGDSMATIAGGWIHQLSR